MNIIGAIVAGLAGTIAMTVLMMIAPMMGMPKMDIPGMLGSMFSAKGNTVLGYVMHLMNGVIFAIIYALIWSTGFLPTNLTGGVVGGLALGLAHWIIVGLLFAMVPIMHAGIKAGEVKAPGLYMTNMGGTMGFIGGMMGHLLFGLVVGVVYAAFPR